MSGVNIIPLHREWAEIGRRKVNRVDLWQLRVVFSDGMFPPPEEQCRVSWYFTARDAVDEALCLAEDMPIRWIGLSEPNGPDDDGPDGEPVVVLPLRSAA